MPSKKIVFVVAFANIAFFSSAVKASEKFFCKVDNYKKYVSDKIDNYSNNIDNFLTQEKGKEKENNSHGRILFNESYENGSLKNNINFRLKLDLPKTKKKYNLTIENHPEGEKSLTQRISPNKATVPNDNNMTFGLNYLAKELNKWKTSYGFGLKARLPMKFFAKASAERDFKVSKKWLGKYKHHFYYFLKDGFVTENKLSFVKNYGANILEYTTHFRWAHKNKTLEYAEVIAYNQVFNPKTSGRFELGVLGSGFKHSNLDLIYTTYTYKKDIYKNWIYLYTIPELSARKENNFNVFPSINMKLEMLF